MMNEINPPRTIVWTQKAGIYWEGDNGRFRIKHLAGNWGLLDHGEIVGAAFGFGSRKDAERAAEVRKLTVKQRMALREAEQVQARLNEIVEYIARQDARARPEAKRLLGDVGDLYAHLVVIADDYWSGEEKP